MRMRLFTEKQVLNVKFVKQLFSFFIITIYWLKIVNKTEYYFRAGTREFHYDKSENISMHRFFEGFIYCVSQSIQKLNILLYAFKYFSFLFNMEHWNHQITRKNKLFINFFIKYFYKCEVRLRINIFKCNKKSLSYWIFSIKFKKSWVRALEPLSVVGI